MTRKKGKCITKRMMGWWGSESGAWWHQPQKQGLCHKSPSNHHRLYLGGKLIFKNHPHLQLRLTPVCTSVVWRLLQTKRIKEIIKTFHRIWVNTFNSVAWIHCTIDNWQSNCFSFQFHRWNSQKMTKSFSLPLFWFLPWVWVNRTFKDILP